jgi:hypothetical protein
MVTNTDHVQRDKSLMVNPDLHRRLRLLAVGRGKKLQETVEELLEKQLAAAEKKAAA